MPEMSKFPALRVPTGDAFPSGLMMDAASIANRTEAWLHE